jgi:Zn-dependent peptidase ImmA (M78 family)
MKNPTIGFHEAEDIREQVRKVLKGLGDPDPPLRLEDVLELLRLDRQYYSSGDDGAVREFVSRVRVATRQLAERPMLLWDVIKKADLSALWVPDRQRILIDSRLAKIKHRWAGAHEVSHSIVPWHKAYLFGDSEEELKFTCRAIIEGEANYGAGQLLFLGERFAREANDSPLTLTNVQALSKRFGNTITSTLWRAVEESHFGLPAVGLVSLPRHWTVPGGSDFHERIRYCVESPAFKERFSTSEAELLSLVDSYCRSKRGGPLGQEEIALRDVNGCQRTFLFESFGNQYEVLSLGVCLTQD